MKLKDKLIELNIKIPDPVAPAGNYVPYKIVNNHIDISGQIPLTKDAIVNPGKETSGNINAPSIITGKVPSEVSVELATKALVASSTETSEGTLPVMMLGAFILPLVSLPGLTMASFVSGICPEISI